MTAIPLSPETQRRLDALFTGTDREVAGDVLISQCGADLPLWRSKSPGGLERIRFAVLKLSKGSMSGLSRAVELAQVDWRDALVAADFANDVRAHEAWFPDGHAA